MAAKPLSTTRLDNMCDTVLSEGAVCGENRLTVPGGDVRRSSLGRPLGTSHRGERHSDRTQLRQRPVTTYSTAQLEFCFKVS